MKLIIKIILFGALLLTGLVFGQENKVDLTLKNQVNTWGTANFRSPLLYQFGGRYLPELSLGKGLGNNHLIDLEASVNATAAYTFEGWEYVDNNGKISPYRAWLRYSNNSMEFRAGLQKINFGSAMLLRPLMWFDQIDPRDPLQLTDGVYAALGKYYFKNNATLWGWFLIGNDKAKGWDFLPSVIDKPEYGGRIQLPLGSGEAALSFNHRIANYEMLNTDSLYTGNLHQEQNKIGLDGKWDVGIGLWYEVVIKHNGIGNDFLNTWQDYINVGADYTFGLGNGLNVVGEFFRVNSSDLLFGKGTRVHFTAVSASYPIGMISNINYIMFVNWDAKEWYRFINFSQTYDYFTINFMAFWNPDNYNLYNINSDRVLYAGKGIQVLAVWNF